MAAFITKERLFSNRWFQAYGMIVLGSFILATGYALFIAPHEIVPGGVFGLAIVIHSFTDLPIGMTALAINIPIEDQNIVNKHLKPWRVKTYRKLLDKGQTKRISG